VERWQHELAAGRPQAAWDLLIERYRALILATIRRLVREHDDVMDVFSTVCEALHENDLARVRRFSADRGGARFSTWLVAVVRNLTVDWLRSTEGRRRGSAPAELSPLQREIYELVFLSRRTHVEAFEAIRARGRTTLTFRAFLRDLRETYKHAPPWPTGQERRELDPLPPEVAVEPTEVAELADLQLRMAGALESLPPSDRLAIELFVIEGLSAADVARTLNWPTAKTVYNRVYRALNALRAALERAGIGSEDLP
jgi:RNA polymerase sigma factor (sigma-70 family)